jgi:hypothetical protein
MRVKMRVRVPHPSSAWVGPLGRKKFQKSAQLHFHTFGYYCSPTSLGSAPSLRKSPAQAELGRGTLVNNNESDALGRAPYEVEGSIVTFDVLLVIVLLLQV